MMDFNIHATASSITSCLWTFTLTLKSTGSNVLGPGSWCRHSGLVSQLRNHECRNPAVLFFLRFYLFIFRERGRERGRETSMHGCFSHAPYWGPGPQPRHVPWLGIQPATLCFTGAQSTERHQPGQDPTCFLMGNRETCLIFSLEEDIALTILDSKQICFLLSKETISAIQDYLLYKYPWKDGLEWKSS